jgi:hypothetical protein
MANNNGVVYEKNSPYYLTPVYGKFLDVARFPNIPRLPDDVVFTINETYQYRPDLLAFDLYGDQGLWWVFALRNPNSIQDPIFDMRVGKKIYIPTKSTLNSVIGIL